MADQWRRQAMGYAGEDPVRTPHMDSLAADSLVFNQSCATRPICSPNRSCMLTGLHPQRHGHYMNGLEEPLDPKFPTLGGLLKDAGYRTSYVGKLHTGGASEQRGEIAPEFRNRWDHWVHAVGHRPWEQPYYLGRDSKPTVHDGWAPTFETDQTIGFIRENRDAPFAAVLSWGPPHTGGGKGMEDRWQPGKRENGALPLGHGYAAPAEFEAPYRPVADLPRRPNVRPVPAGNGEQDPSDHTLPGYFGACTSLDFEFGRLIEELREQDVLENTLVVFTSDHGEMLGSQGRMQKGIFYEESIGVPLFMRLGTRLPSRRVDDLVTTIDLLPTMLGILGVETSARFDGNDYSRFALGRTPSAGREAFLSFDAGGPNARPDQANGSRRAWRTLRTLRHSYSILDDGNARQMPGRSRRVLFDLANDPYQMAPITGGAQRDLMDQMHGRLLAHLDSLGDDFARTKFVW